MSPATGDVWRRRLGNGLLAITAVLFVVWVWFVWVRVSTPAPPEVDLSRVEPLIGDAITAARDAASARPRDPQAWGELGMVLHAHEMFPSAREAYTRAEALDPTDVRWPYLAGVTQVAPGDRVADYRRAVAAAPDSQPARLRLADALIELGRYDEAAAEYGGALHGDLRAHARVGLARIALARGDAREAVAEAEEALSDAPTLAAAHSVLAAAYFRQGHTERAAQSEERARAADAAGGWPDPYVAEMRARQSGLLGLGRRATDLYRAGHHEQALELLELLVQRHPESVPAQAGLGRMYVLLGRLAEGESTLRAAIARDAGPLEPHLYLGVALMQQRRCAEAVPVFRDLIARQPDYGQAHLALGQCLYELGDTPAAAAALADAARYTPDAPLAHKNLGIVLIELGRPDEAIQALERASVLAPEDTSIHTLLIRARNR